MTIERFILLVLCVVVIGLVYKIVLLDREYKRFVLATGNMIKANDENWEKQIDINSRLNDSVHTTAECVKKLMEVIQNESR